MTEEFFAHLTNPYQNYSNLQIVLEITAVLFGVLSVYFSWQNKLWVFPTGIVSTLIYVYLLTKFGLYGDVLINAYYFLMSVYGWHHWSGGKMLENQTQMTYIEKKNLSFLFLIFFFSLVFVISVYASKYWFLEEARNLEILFFEKFVWTDWLDSFTTAIFFVGMWLMARKKIENWYFWIVGDIISIPLYLYKGLAISSLQFFVFTIFAIFGLLAWKQEFRKNHTNAN